MAKIQAQPSLVTDGQARVVKYCFCKKFFFLIFDLILGPVLRYTRYKLTTNNNGCKKVAAKRAVEHTKISWLRNMEKTGNARTAELFRQRPRKISRADCQPSLAGAAL